jgi:hypothetical protein
MKSEIVKNAWKAVAEWPTKFYSAKKSRTVGQKASGGCLSFIFFGIAFVFVPLAIMLTVWAALSAYALAVTIAYGCASGVTRVRQRKQA